MVGEGSDRPRYERSVRDLGLDGQVQFAGRLVGAERDAAVRQAAVQLVYPTTANDGLPTVLLEAWAQGVPVIAAAIGSIPALVTERETGLLAAPNNPAKLVGLKKPPIVANAETTRPPIRKRAIASLKGSRPICHALQGRPV